uniref:Uncharacterized protein n=1 Tax=candidate division WOR-3 bacterium TaxID=2052148 RepID=A0A7C6ED85_UNCW3
MVFGDSLVVLSYHAQDYDTFNNPLSKARARLYNPGIEPVCFFDGSGPVSVQDPDSFYARYQDQILGARSQTTSLRLELEFDTKINIKINVIPTESLPDPANLRLFVVVYEKVAPYLSGFPPFDTMHAFFVVRKFLPDTLGLNLSFLNFPNSFDTVFTTQLENWDSTQIGVASFVQNIQTKKVLQAVKKIF